ncbi:MAG TPA: FAD-dependent monooxygenase [Ktedonobacteraceae bacterium]|nr:FAD-dependent monooxygenase [Ktedonobacteraceae bacterium]
MKIVILGAGPAGLYAGLLIKKANPAHDISIIERNPADVTYGWGVVFSDRTLASFQRADYKTYEQIRDHFVIWNDIDTRYRGETIRCGGHVIASISRKLLLNILQRRCAELGISLTFGREIADLSELGSYDLLVAADGINSIVRKTYEPIFKPSIELGKARYIWLGANKVLDAFTFIFRENEQGLFQVHAYPFSGTTSTFIVECDEATWLRAGLDQADEAQSLAFCQQLLAGDLNGAQLLSNNSKWINFATLKTRHWHHQNIVLLGDAVHTAHFSIGSGTKLAMEDAIALAGALEQHSDLETALNEYELERKPVVETFQRAAQESQTYFETLKRYLGLEPLQFTFQLLTRSGRITYDDLRMRDIHFVEAVDRWFAFRAFGDLPTDVEDGELSPDDISIVVPPVAAPAIIASSAAFTLLRLRDLVLSNRIAVCHTTHRASSYYPVQNGLLNEAYANQLVSLGLSGAGLVLTEIVAVSPGGRISPDCPGMYDASHEFAWEWTVAGFHGNTLAKMAIQLGHAGHRGSTRPRSEGLDRPLRNGNWPLLSASPLPYTSHSQVPKEMDLEDMQRVRDDFVRAAQMAGEAHFDMLQLHFGHGYLLASFLSPLTNRRTDEYGGDLQHRMRYPLEVFDAVRAVWPEDKPISVALSVTDGVKGGFEIEDAIVVAQALKEHGCDIIQVLAGQTTMDGEPAYGRGFLTSLSDRVRNEAGIPTMVGGYLTTSDEVNTILAAGRADLCLMDSPHLNDAAWAAAINIELNEDLLQYKELHS